MPRAGSMLKRTALLFVRSSSLCVFMRRRVCDCGVLRSNICRLCGFVSEPNSFRHTSAKAINELKRMANRARCLHIPDADDQREFRALRFCVYRVFACNFVRRAIKCVCKKIR